MGKNARAIRKDKRLQKKRAIKASNVARYAELRRIGENGKSTRFRRKSRRVALVGLIDHPNGKCGNVACKKCDPGKIF